MKTSFPLVFLVVSAVAPLLAQEAGTGAKKTFYQRFFGPDGPAAKSESRGGTSAAPAEPKKWDLFPPSRLPAGKTVNDTEAAKLPDGSYTGRTTYLEGRFVVTAAIGSQAVLRAENANPSMRIIAEYPPAAEAPHEGARLSLNASNGLVIQHVKRSADETVNVHVRSITQP